MSKTDPASMLVSNRAAPATAAERREQALSFGDQESLVYKAVLAYLGDGATDSDGSVDCWIRDLAEDWVVWQSWTSHGPGVGLWKMSYSIDDDSNVALTGEPQSVVAQTSYVAAPEAPAEKKSRKPAGPAALITPDNQIEVLRSIRELALQLRSDTGDRQLRSALRQSMRKTREERVFGDLEYEVRQVSGSSDLLFSGYACITGEDDASYEMEDWLGPWVESVSRNAFRKTLAEKPDVIFVENHDGRPLCRTSDGRLSLAERVAGDPTGLHVEARLNGARHDVHDVMRAVEDGTYNQMSFAFRVTRQDWDDDYTRRWIREVSLANGDVSIVSYAANPHTAGTTSATVGSVDDPIRSRSADQLRFHPLSVLLAHAEFRNWQAGCEWRAGKTLSTATMETLRQVLAWCSEADTALDQAQPALADLMGVANPDDDQDDEQKSATTGAGGQRSRLVIPDTTASARAALARYRKA